MVLFFCYRVEKDEVARAYALNSAYIHLMWYKITLSLKLLSISEFRTDQRISVSLTVAAPDFHAPV